MRSKTLLSALIFIITTAIAFSRQTDSLEIEKLKQRIEKVESFENNTKDALDNKFDKLSNKIEDDYDLLKKLGWMGLGLNFLFLLGILWQGKKYVEKQLKSKFDNIITQKEGDILDLIDNQSEEKTIVKNKKVLVLTAKDGDDLFLRNFFKKTGFQIDNVKYVKVDSFHNDLTEGVDVIFANNESDDLSFDLITNYFSNSEPKTVLFYFNTTRRHYSNDNIVDKLSFANTKTQIYGNLINLLRYQKVL